MPVSDCGADSSPSSRQKGSLASSISPCAFSIMAAKGEASASASSRAAERFSACSVSRCGPMSCRIAITPAALSRGSSAGWKAICTQRSPIAASAKAVAALPSPTRTMFCCTRFWSAPEKSEASETLTSAPRSRPLSARNAPLATTIAPFASVIATATFSESTMRLKSSIAMGAGGLARIAQLADHVQQVLRGGMQGDVRAAHGRQHLRCDGLAQLHAELVVRVDDPDGGEHVDLVLVDREEGPEVVGVELRQHEGRAHAIARAGAMRVGGRDAVHQRLRLRADVREQDLVVDALLGHGARDDDEVARRRLGALVRPLMGPL